MMFARHPEVASQIVQQLEGYLFGASSARVLSGTVGFDPPSWQALCEGVRPRMLEPEEFEPGIERGCWQHEASSRVERQHREEVVFERLLPRDRAWVRSQSGPGGSLALTTCPTSVLTKIPQHMFRVVLLRRLRLPFLFLLTRAVGGLPIDSFGHHRASCTRTGAFESAAARVCREAGGRVTTNVMVRDLDLPVLNATDSRWLEVVVDGLPSFGGSQLAVDTTLVCSLHSQWGCGHRRRDLPSGQAAQRAEIPRVGGPGSRAPPWLSMWVAGGRRSRAHSSLSWRRERLDENRVSCSGGSCRLGRSGIEPSLSCAAAKAVASMSPGPQVRAWVGRRHSSHLEGGGGPPPRRVGCVRVFGEAAW